MSVCRAVSVSEEIPTVTGDIEEDCDSTVGLGMRWANEGDAGLGHPPVRRVEVIDTEEESDSSRYLVTDGRALPLAVCAGKKKPSLRAGRTDDHPALRSSIVGERRRVFYEVEPEHAGEEGNGRVILIDDQGHQVDLHPGSIRTVVASPRCRAMTAAADVLPAARVYVQVSTSGLVYPSGDQWHGITRDFDMSSGDGFRKRRGVVE